MRRISRSGSVSKDVAKDVAASEHCAAQPLFVFCSAHVFWHFVQILFLLQLFSLYAFS